MIKLVTVAIWSNFSAHKPAIMPIQPSIMDEIKVKKILLFLNQDHVSCRKRILKHSKNKRNFFGEIEKNKKPILFIRMLQEVTIKKHRPFQE